MYDKTPLDILEYHHSMLLDKVRTGAFKRAIAQQVQPGDVVLDIGCGSGILTYFACMAGAKRVYALEQGPMFELAQTLCRQNGFADRVLFLHDWSTKITLPELADVLITETIGNIGFDEGIVGWILDAKKRNLKPQARIVPRTLSLCAVPVQAKKDYADVARWEADFYGLNFAAARTIAANNLMWTTFDRKQFMSQPATMLTVNLNEVDTETFSAERPFPITKNGVVHGIGGWFAAEIAPGINLTSKPKNQTPSWSHGFMPLARPLHVEIGDILQVRLQMRANAAQWRWDVTLSYPGSGSGSAADRIEQTTLRGDLKPAPLLKTAVPTRSQSGEIDLFILQKMDGRRTIEEIAQETAVRFPARHPTYDHALTQVQQVADYYKSTPDRFPTAQPAKS